MIGTLRVKNTVTMHMALCIPNVNGPVKHLAMATHLTCAGIDITVQ